ncbi:MAG: D-alanyl-D-alanine-carboxypeptidase/D-alanyl-D-alanine-endopeptidase, partial [Patescibacteria group bacterium]
VVGVIDSDGTHFYSYGVKSLETKEAVDEHSVFEIGSISKTFTGILLADMVVKKELKLEDPLQKHLPEGITAPTRNGESIKLVHMANHTSSLPRMPDNFTPANPANPYADYSEKQLYEFLESCELTRDIGSEYEYSNYAVGLLGHTLAAKHQMTYEDLLVEIIAKPLGLKDTRTVFTPNMKKNLAMGHSGGAQVENWDLSSLAGAGAIRSTAVDMLKYIAANMGKEKSSLYPAMQLSHQNTTMEGSSSLVGLAWHIESLDSLEVIAHGGATGGYRAFAGFISGGDKGVVVLTNSAASIGDIGAHLLNPATPLKDVKPSITTKLRQVIDEEGIEAGVKNYRDLKKNHADKYDFSESELNRLGYVYLGKEDIEKAIAIFKINVEAYPDASNVYDSLGEALLKNGNKEKAITNYKKSVELDPSNEGGLKILKELGVDTKGLVKEVIIDDAVLKSYVGEYELMPGFVLTVSKDGKQMSAQATGQPQFPIFPKSESVFYLKVVQAQLTFNKNEKGVIESATLLQGGQETTGKKMKKKTK